MEIPKPSSRGDLLYPELPHDELGRVDGKQVLLLDFVGGCIADAANKAGTGVMVSADTASCLQTSLYN